MAGAPGVALYNGWVTCRVCLKRPEIPDDRFDRCEPCAKAGRAVYKFRLGPLQGKFAIKAGELSPHGFHEKLAKPLTAFTGNPSVKPHLLLHEVELVLAKDKLEVVRISKDLETQPVMEVLRASMGRNENAWA
jgi:hypothetical protein